MTKIVLKGLKIIMTSYVNRNNTPLAFLRKKAGLSRNKAAVLLNVGLTTLARYENGDNDVPFGIGEKMTILYNVPFETVRFAIRDTKKIQSAQAIRDTPLRDK